jgi:hypothetical protein
MPTVGSSPDDVTGEKIGKPQTSSSVLTRFFSGPGSCHRRHAKVESKPERGDCWCRVNFYERHFRTASTLTPDPEKTWHIKTRRLTRRTHCCGDRPPPDVGPSRSATHFNLRWRRNSICEPVKLSGRLDLAVETERRKSDEQVPKFLVEQIAK